jgi:type I restriction enzyme S subunit
MENIQVVYRFFPFENLITNSDKVYEGDFRLNAEFYEVNTSIEIDTKIHFKPLADFATVIFPGIFKRILANSQKYGIGFLTTSEMMMIEPIPEKFLSNDLTTNLDIYRVSENTLLISRSGTIGNIIYVCEELKKYAITEDALRVIPFDVYLLGFLYFYFISDYGNSLITGKKSGAVIDHIYEEDLLKIPIPIIDSKIVHNFNDVFQKIKQNRVTANRLLREARSLVLLYNNLPPLSESEFETIDPTKKVEIRMVSISEFTDDYRLDAHFYNSMADKAVKNIVSFSSDFKTLDKGVAKRVFYLNRFTRTFVENEHGIPYLAGKDIIKIRPYDVSYLSKSETVGLSNYKLEKGWILMTCSGTLGRTCFIWNNFENWVGTHDLIRIVSENEFDSGYLISFLSTEYGYYQALRYKHGAVIDHLTPEQVGKIIVPIPNKNNVKEIGDLVRQAYDLRAEAIKLEGEAQVILAKALTGK